jgi:indolepyruvate ferredoxin oxidoreductase beta subunit
MAATRLLIAALGGEGGGVLTSWLVHAAQGAGLAVQATSVPGVAQRTGATTYYLEFARIRRGGKPVFALMPVAGDVDIVLATELLEAVRMAERGFIVPERTFLISSVHRVLTTHEKLARGDGRLDAAGLMATAERASRQRFLFDARALSQQRDVPVNALLLGVLAGFELLDISVDHYRAAIEAGGIAVARNLAGFDAGLAYSGAQAGAATETARPAQSAGLRGMSAPLGPPAPPAPPDLAERLGQLPDEARETARLGVQRLVDFQNVAYAARYLDRLAPFTDDPALMREVARHLAVRMSFEDIFRVAQLKIKKSRLDAVRVDVGAEWRDPHEIIDFFKPGIRELADALPPAMGRWLLRREELSGRLDKVYLGMKVRSTTITGFLRLWLLAKLRRWRPRTLRFAEEQARIDAWLDLVARAQAVSSDFAIQTAELARLVKGYGETHRRGIKSYDDLVEKMVRPALAQGTAVEEPAAQLRGALKGLLAQP